MIKPPELCQGWTVSFFAGYYLGCLLSPGGTAAKGSGRGPGPNALLLDEGVAQQLHHAAMKPWGDTDRG